MNNFLQGEADGGSEVNPPARKTACQRRRFTLERLCRHGKRKTRSSKKESHAAPGMAS